MEYHVCGEDKNVEKRKSGSNVMFPIILRLLVGKISSEEKGKGTKIFLGKNKDLKKWGSGRIASCRELYIPLLNCT